MENFLQKKKIRWRTSCSKQIRLSYRKIWQKLVLYQVIESDKVPQGPGKWAPCYLCPAGRPCATSLWPARLSVSRVLKRRRGSAEDTDPLQQIVVFDRRSVGLLSKLFALRCSASTMKNAWPNGGQQCLLPKDWEADFVWSNSEHACDRCGS